MADPLSETDRWGLNPDAPPPPVVQQQPQQQPSPLTFSESQRWGTEALPGQTRPAPYAFDTGAPPVPPGPPQQQPIDDAREYDKNKVAEVEAFKNNRLSIIDFNPLPDQYAREQHPDWQKYQNAQRMIRDVPNLKERTALQRQIDALGKRIDNDTKVRNTQAGQSRREQLARDDAPYTSPKAREETAEVLRGALTTTLGRTLGDVASGNPEVQRRADYTVATSPITTMSTPLPGTNPDDKPTAENRDYTPLVNAATSIAVHNRNLPNDLSIKYALKIASPGGGTDEQGKQTPGFNGRTGMGAKNYKVIGRDELDNVLVLMDDGKRLRIPGDTYRQLNEAHKQGVQRGRQWEEKFKESQKEGLVRKAINWGISKIPGQGF